MLRIRRHWKHSRFKATDDFVWARHCLWEGEERLLGEPVDKAALGEKKLFRLWRARFIEAKYTPPIIKDPQAPPVYPAEDLALSVA